MSAIANLEKLNITIPDLAAPAAAYLPFTRSGNIIFVSGQLPFVDGALSHTGHLGDNVTEEQGQQTAYDCAINVIAQLKAALGGDLDKVTKVLKIEILVAATPDFGNAHIVANGASNLIKDVFGDDIGAHARVAYSVAALPMNAAVEVAATVEVA
jgi:enamine deaminase RidA (YjgF/YER057c/UK114 family)